jgi:catechol 2,3-dioxygenase-like lactoylglutathione lyase family enzyme
VTGSLDRRQFVPWALFALTAIETRRSAFALGATAPLPLIGIDHIPFVVRDLEQAADTWRRLGFVIKPGRFHTDGIRNNHVKFPDGAGIELITAPAATDELTRHYTQMISQGEGPAYVSFHPSSEKALIAAAESLGEPYSLQGNLMTFRNQSLQWLFLGEGSNRSPGDRPEHFAHPNGANATLAVWIACGDQDRKRALRLFRALGATVDQKVVRAPDPLRTSVATVENGGEVIFLPGKRQLLPGRPIVGIVFRTRDLSAALHALRSAGVEGPRSVETPAYRSLIVHPHDTRGVWLEFREDRA